MRVRVVPSPGLLVRDPETNRHLPPEGADVLADSTYWLRRIADGDVSLAPTSVTTKARSKRAPEE